MFFTLAWGLVGLPLLLLIYGTGYLDHVAGQFDQTSPLALGAWDVLITWLLPFIALYVFWVLRGATPGKMATSIRIVDARTGLPASPLQLAVRLAGYLVSMLAMGIGFIWIFFDKRRQGLHDKLARTMVIDTWQPAEEQNRNTDQSVKTAAEPSISGSAPSAGQPSVLTTFHLAVFQLGTSLLLLSVLAHGIRHFLVRSEILERQAQSFLNLREAGLYPDWLEITFLHAQTLATLLAAGLGLFLVWGAKQHREARLLALFLGFYFFCGCVVRAAGVDPDLTSMMDRLAQWLALAAMLRFAVNFPRALSRDELTLGQSPEQWGPIRRSWWWGRTLFKSNPPQPGSSRGVRSLLLSPSIVWGGAIVTAALFHLTPDLSETGQVVTFMAVAGLLIVAADMLWTNIKRASATDRNRGLWVAYGLLLAILVPFLIGVGSVAVATSAYLAGVGEVFDMAEEMGSFSALVSIHISPLILTVALAFGMFYRGEISPGFAIRKTTLYAALGMIGILVFAGVEHLLSNQLARILPLPDSASGLISAMLGAGAIGLFRSKLRVRTDALFNKLLADSDSAKQLASEVTPAKP